MQCFFFKPTDSERRQLIHFYRTHLNDIMQDVDGFVPLKPWQPNAIMPTSWRDAKDQPAEIQNLIYGLEHSKDWQIVVAKHQQQWIGLLISNGLNIKNAQGRHLRNIETICVDPAWRNQGVATQMIEKLSSRFAVDCVRCEPARFYLWEKRGFAYPTAFSQLDHQQQLISVRFYLAQHDDDFQHAEGFAWPSLHQLREAGVLYDSAWSLTDKALLFDEIFCLGQTQHRQRVEPSSAQRMITLQHAPIRRS